MGWAPIIMIKSLFFAELNKGCVYFDVKFEVWNWRPYPCIVLMVRITFGDLQFTEILDPKPGPDGKNEWSIVLNKLKRFGDISIGPSSHQKFDLRVKFEVQDFDTLTKRRTRH